MLDRHYSRKALAERLGRSPSWVDKQRREGRLKATYVGRVPMYSERAVKAFLARCDEDKVSRGHDELISAIDWMARNPDAAGFIEREAMAAAARGDRVSVRRLIEDARERDWVAKDGGASNLDNNLCSALSRLLVREHPELAKAIEHRVAAVDAVVLG